MASFFYGVSVVGYLHTLTHTYRARTCLPLQGRPQIQQHLLTTAQHRSLDSVKKGGHEDL